ncbi:ABC transporter permease [Pseudonocardia spinosispora]|uniref:ABC transporter permease n=1 Tax=Pseudonocardia spinosispora TaxID=103441 RepID=UPI00048EA8CC|nr:ABC transporter permease [Pseudonocardia spinosispora]
MGLTQAFAIALRSMRASALRSALTTLGIVVGIAAVIVLFGLGQGVRTNFHDNYSPLTESIIVSKTAAATGPVSSTESLRESDLEALQSSGSPAIASVTPLRSGTAVVKYGQKAISVSIAGVNGTYLAIRGRVVAAGRMFTDEEGQAKERLIVLGPDVVTDLFGGDTNAALGSEVRVGRLLFRVVGVLAPEHDSQDVLGLIPLDSVREVIGGADTLNGIGVEAASVDQVPEAYSVVTGIMDRQHGIVVAGMRDYRAVAVNTQVLQIESVVNLLTWFTMAVAVIALFVGALGVANIMLITVKERTSEIGVRKAIGARRGAIMRQFLTEAVVLSGVGGVLGVGAGFAATVLADRLLPRYLPELGAPEISVPAALVAFAVSLGIGLAAGGYPAFRAASLNPIDALRAD